MTELTTEADSYQALTSQEEQDLLRMMSDHETAVSNAEAFADQLNRELSGLDGVSTRATGRAAERAGCRGGEVEPPDGARFQMPRAPRWEVWGRNVCHTTPVYSRR